MRFVYENNIPVIRRISGGGTVFHDEGNLNFSFITRSEKGKQVDFRKYTAPVIEFLKDQGVTAFFEGKNDLRVNGLKISGNAEHVYRERVLHHGTLLFSTNIDNIRGSLRSDTGNYSGRAVSSNPSPVMNLDKIMENIKNIYELKDRMADFFMSGGTITDEFKPGFYELNEIKSLSDSKYRTWEWNYAYGPEYQFNNNFILKGAPCHCSLSVKSGVIAECKTEGTDEIVRVSGLLTGCRHKVEDMLDVLKSADIMTDDSEVFNFI